MSRSSAWKLHKIKYNSSYLPPTEGTPEGTILPRNGTLTSPLWHGSISSHRILKAHPAVYLFLSFFYQLFMIIISSAD